MFALDEDEYTLRMGGTPRPKNRGTVLGADGEHVLDVVWEGLRGPVWYTVQRPDGTPVFRIETVAASVGPARFTTRRYDVVTSTPEETVATLVKRFVGPFKTRFDVESAEGERIGTVASRSRLKTALRLVPLWWLVMGSPAYDVTTPDGERTAVILRRHRSFGKAFKLLIPRDAVPWQAVVAAAVILDSAGFANRIP